MIFGVTIFTIIANIYLGFAVFLRNKKSATSRLFLIYAISVANWAMFNYLALVPGLSPEVSLLRIRLTLVSAAIMAPLIYLLSYTFPETKEQIPKKVKIFFWVFVLGTAIVSMLPITFKEVIFINGFPVPKIGPGVAIYGLNILLLPVMAFMVLLKKYRKTTGREKIQIKLFMYGIAISYFLAEVTNFLLVNIFQNSSLTIFGPFFTLILVGFVFYAITRYHFLDIKLFVLRSVTYLLITALVIIFYIVGLIVGIEYIFPSTTIPKEIYWIIIFLSTAISIGVNPLHKRIEKYLGKFFFKERYSSENLIFNTMQIMAKEIDFDILAPQILNKVTKTIGISKMAILSIEQHKVNDIKELGFKNIDKSEKLSQFEDVFHQPELSEIIIFDEITNKDLKEVFRGTDIEIIVPVKIQDKEIALIIYGSKTNGEMYNDQDLDVIKIISKQIGESIENTSKFKKLKIVDSVRSDFVDSVSHEFLTPLTEGRWKLESILDPENENKLPDETRKDISDIYLSIRWLVESLNQLIIASNFETTNFVLNKSESSIQDVINDVIKDKVKEIALLKSTNIETNIETGLFPINIDSVKIKQVLTIGLENAIKYSKDGSTVSILAKIRESEDKNKFIHIEIKDNGIGISDADMSNMFSKFYRGNDARHNVPNGLGLGLYLSKTFIEMHNGKIWLESNKKTGTTLFIEIPY